METDPVAIDGQAGRRRGSLAETDGRAGPVEIVDRLATLARRLGDTVPAERPEQRPVERERALEVGDDEIDVMETGGADRLPSLSVASRYIQNMN